MKKYILIILALFSFSATNAETEWKLSDDGTLTISGKGDMPDYTAKKGNDKISVSAPWYSQKNKIKKIVIEDGVTSIGDGAFNVCRSLTSITIPISVTSIGDYAFSDCSGLTSITIPNSVTSIGEGTFSDCFGLTSIIVEEGNAKYDSRDNGNAIIETKSNTLIAGCKNAVIPNTVTSIGGSAFFGCVKLTSITIPNSVTSIGDKAFYYCEGLTSITIPNSVTRIGDNAFSGCKGLDSITIPNSVTGIGNNAFASCKGLASVRIPNSVTNIGNYAFAACDSLTSITFEGSTPPEFGKEVFKYVKSTIPVYVPANSIEAYKKALKDYFEESSIRNK